MTTGSGTPQFLAALVGLWLLAASTVGRRLSGILRRTLFCSACLVLCLLMGWGNPAGAQVMQIEGEHMPTRSANVRLPVPALTARVMDPTHRLTATEKSTLTQQLTEMDARFGTQMVVLIVPSTQSESIESYSLRVAKDWRLGRADVGDGLLFVIAKNDRTMRLEVAQALEGTIPDIAAARILDHLVTPAFQQGDFAGGISAAIAAIVKRLEGDATLPAPPASHRATQAFSGMDSPPIWEQVKQSPLVTQYYTWLPFYAVVLMLCVLTPLAKPIGRLFGYAMMALTVGGFFLLLAYVIRTYKPAWNYAFVERFYHASLAYIPALVFDPAFWLLSLVSVILLCIYTPFGGMLGKIIGLILGLGLTALFVGMFGMLIFFAFPFFAVMIGIGLFQNRRSLREAWNLYQRKKRGEDIEWSTIQKSLNGSHSSSRSSSSSSSSRSRSSSSSSSRSSSRSGGGGRSSGGGASGRW